MKAATIYRIYTEQKNHRDIVRMVSGLFDSFTLQPTDGYYKGKKEQSIVIELVGVRERPVSALASAIRAMNGQKSVLVLKLRGASKIFRD